MLHLLLPWNTGPRAPVSPSRAVLAVILCAVALLSSAAAAASALAASAVPQGFVGMNADGPLFTDPSVNVPHQLNSMVSSGVETLRVAFDWAQAEPYASWNDVPPSQMGSFQSVPPDHVPMSFASIDKLVTMAAERGMTILPIVIDAPDWAVAKHPPGTFGRPRSNATYARFVKALVQRYGPKGSFWSPGLVPKVPIRMWQIWNEPDLNLYWQAKPFAPSYMALVRAAHDAIKSADPGGKVVLAGLTNFSWNDLATVYKVPHARRWFDIVAVHPYTQHPAGVITILQKVRDVMKQGGDKRKPLIATELGWPSSYGRSSQFYGFETNESGQASRLSALLPMLGRDRQQLNLLGFYYYNWIGHEYRNAPTFAFAGLLRINNGKITPKPAFNVFRRGTLKLEGCHAKAHVATHCA